MLVRSLGRRRRTFGLPALGALLSFVAVVRPSPASEKQISLNLSVAGPEGCDDRGALEREVKRRAERVEFVGTDDASVAISVRLNERSDGFQATLVVDRPSRTSTTRVITAGNCQEVLEGAALIIAVLLSGSTQEERPATPSPIETLPPPEPEAEDSGDSSEWRLGGGAAFALSAGIAPGLLPGVEAFLSAGVEVGGHFPELRLGVKRAWRSGFAVDDARATFRLTSGVVSFCPVSGRLGDAFSLRPCALASYGELQASGEGVANPRSERHPFAGVGVGLRLDATLLPSLAIELALSAEAALVNSRFRFGGVAFHETSPVAGHAAFGLVLRLP